MRMEFMKAWGEREEVSSRLLKALYAPVCVSDRAADVVQCNCKRSIVAGLVRDGDPRMIEAKAACMRCIAAMYPVTAVR